MVDAKHVGGIFCPQSLKKNPKNKEWNNNQKETAMVVVVKVAVVGSCCWFGFRCTEGEEGVKKEKIKKTFGNSIGVLYDCSMEGEIKMEFLYERRKGNEREK